MNNAMYLDTETSGLTAGHHVILEIAAVHYVDGKEIAAFSELARPDEWVLEDPTLGEALAINKIPLDQLRVAAYHTEVADRFHKFIERCQADSYHTFNVAFDGKFLELDPWLFDRTAWGECVMQASAKIMDPWRKRWPKLAAAAAHFHCEWDGDAHRALADARMAAKVHQQILKRRVSA